MFLVQDAIAVYFRYQDGKAFIVFVTWQQEKTVFFRNTITMNTMERNGGNVIFLFTWQYEKIFFSGTTLGVFAFASLS